MISLDDLSWISVTLGLSWSRSLGLLVSWSLVIPLEQSLLASLGLDVSLHSLSSISLVHNIALFVDHLSY